MQLKDFHYMVCAFQGDTDAQITYQWNQVSQFPEEWELYKTCWEYLGSPPWTFESQQMTADQYNFRKGKKPAKPNRRVLNA